MSCQIVEIARMSKYSALFHVLDSPTDFRLDRNLGTLFARECLTELHEMLVKPINNNFDSMHATVWILTKLAR